jgi:hypothetical protein
VRERGWFGGAALELFGHQCVDVFTDHFGDFVAQVFVDRIGADEGIV